jgi:hypothetical protein
LLVRPYSPDLAPSNFFLFPTIKSMLKGAYLLFVEEVKVNMMELLNSLAENGLHHCFQQS